MDIATLLLDAQIALALAKGLPVVVDPRITLVLEAIGSSLTLVQSIHAQGVFDPARAIEVDDFGKRLHENLQAQLVQLATVESGGNNQLSLEA